MDDQFNGRTDDDLFADDFEPVEPTYIEPTKDTAIVPTPSASSAPEPLSTNPAQPAPAPAPAASKPGGLSQSRHAAPRPAHHRQQRKHSPKPTPESSATAASKSDPAQTNATTSSETSATTSAPTGPAAGTIPGSNTAGPNRHLSGANPRQKLTDSELEAKMEKMRILNAEKTRKFEEAEQDQRSHALAYEKGMEEARKRRAEEAERRKRGEEERRKLDEEREKNRERKLKALGSWDQEKTERIEDERRRGGNLFRGINGGGFSSPRRGGGGLGASRYADRDPTSEEGIREFKADEFRGRGRGPRGGRGSGRGNGRGRGNHQGNHYFHGEHERGEYRNGHDDITPSDSISNAPEPLRPEDFPALPAAPKQIDTSVKPSVHMKLPALSPGPNSPLLGKWDDEMEALDAKAKAEAAATS